MKRYTKSELLSILRDDNQQGIAFNQQGIALQVMTFHEFLEWYTDTTASRISLQDQDAYKRLEGRYNDDNGSGGIFYHNAEAIARVEDDNDEWQSLFEKEPQYMVIEYTNDRTTSYLNGSGNFGLREYAVYLNEQDAQQRVEYYVTQLADEKLRFLEENDRAAMRELMIQEASRLYTIEEVEEEEEETED